MQIERVFAELAKAIDCKLETVDASKFIAKVKSFQEVSQKLDVAESESLITESDGLQHYEIATLIAAAEESGTPGDHVWPGRLTARTNQGGYRDIAATLGIAGLKRKGLVETERVPSGNFDEEINVTIVSSNGWVWLESNIDRIDLHLSEEQLAQTTFTPNVDVPF